ncbi:hypothetical protein [Streptomyces vinaceus]
MSPPHEAFRHRAPVGSWTASEALTDRGGAEPTDAGKTVWFECHRT